MRPRLIAAVVAGIVAIVSGAAPVYSKALPSPGTADPSIVPQRVFHQGEAGYNVIPISQFHPNSSGANSGMPFFRGGAHSMAPASTGTRPAPRSTLTPSAPRINVASGPVNKPGLTAANTQQSAPPDSTGAVGPGNYVEMANSNIAVYDRSLNLVNSTTFWNFAGYPSYIPFCDPQIQWAPGVNRWLFSFLYCGNDPNNQGVVVGWSKTSVPTTLSGAGWCQFAYTTGTFLFDFMKLGHNSNYMILGGNYFANPTTNSPSFITSAIVWIPLPAAGDTSCTAPASTGGTSANPLKNGDGVSNTFTPVPVNTDSSAANGYILSSYDPSGSNGQAPGPRSKVSVWHLDPTGVLHGDSDVTVNSYSPPPSAPQPGTGDVLDTLTGVLTQAVGDPVSGIYTQHTVAGAGGRSQVDWFELTASGVNLTLAQQGTISSPTDWVFNAAISPRFDALGATVVYNRSSPTHNPLIAAQMRYAATAPGLMNAGELILATSPAPDTDQTCNFTPGAPCRWGDYAGTSPDPSVQNLVWGSSEFNTASGTTPAWSDENFAIAPTPEAPTNLHAYARLQNEAEVYWTPGASDPAFPTTSYTVIAYSGVTAVAQMTITAPATNLDFNGLTPGVTYTFTVTANSSAGASLESAHSNTVIAGDKSAAQSSGTSMPSPRDPATQSSPPPTGCCPR